jgi:hypothetical protein
MFNHVAGSADSTLRRGLRRMIVEDNGANNRSQLVALDELDSATASTRR